MSVVDDNLGIVVPEKGRLVVEPVPEPEPAPDEAVVAIRYGGICGSDLHYWLDGASGQSVIRAPLRLGHEIVGVVAHAAADGSGPAEGTPVAVHPGGPGGSYLGSATLWPHTQGAFARRVALRSAMLRPLPDGLDLLTAAVTEPASVAMHGVSLAGDVAGRRVLVTGAGPIGALVVAVLARAGAAEIVATDLHERPRQAALEVGATAVLDARDGDAVATLDADIAIESSGTVPGLAAAVSGVRRGGRVVLVGLQAVGMVPAPMASLITREITLTGSFRFVDEIDRVLPALADGSLRTEGVVTHQFALADALEAFEVARDPARSGKVLLSF
ncbi:zinc-binding dehydrogenase [Gryllotalpicola reticulitermitis]|uniref:Zinc-binding dehydrogenase n=1 Tax=Gryllotalpicola reticulitermitis TaxID=1184153 RepID=A0ABV8Q3M4_9MICO